MNCYYHNDIPAVAQCSECGKFLCQNCIDNTSPVLCGECSDYIVQQSTYDKMKSEKKFKRGLIICFLISIPYALGCLIYGRILEAAMFLIMITCAPYGWRELRKLRDKLDFLLILPVLGWAMYYTFVWVISVLTGWIFALREIRQQRGVAYDVYSKFRSKY